MRSERKRLWVALLLVSLVLLGCQAATKAAEWVISSGEQEHAVLSAIPEPVPAASETAIPPILPTPQGVVRETAPPAAASVTPAYSAASQSVAFQVRLHPDGELYSGDQVSVEVIALQDAGAGRLRVEVGVDTPGGEQTGSADFGRYGIAGRYQATLYWVWDTTGLPAGDYQIDYAILPGGPSWIQTVSLLPADDLPPLEQTAAWAAATSECCTLHYITGTAAERDLQALLEMADEQARSASARLGAAFPEPISIALLPRVLGHGGFTSQDISVSYLDRNYAGSTPEIVLHHELVHALDSRLGGDLRPTMLVEGLAVYLSGGHFKPEPLMGRAAALLELDRYLPLGSLADNFYPSQHEIGYMESGALVEYMIGIWGWEAFSAFYRDIHPGPPEESGGGNSQVSWSQSEAIDVALQAHFGLSFQELEGDFVEAVQAESVTDDLRQDVRLSIRQYDAIRRYQQALDTSAYFMTAWLPDGKRMRESGIVADFLRHPSAVENLVLETLLVSADEHLRAGEFAQAQAHLEAVETVLDALEQGTGEALSAHPLAADYLALIRMLMAQGYQAQRIRLDKNTARVWVTRTGLYLDELELVRSGDGWSLPDKLNY